MFCKLLGLALLVAAASYAADESENDIPVICKILSVTPVSCPFPSSDGLHPHPDACGLFYYCPPGHAAPICRTCPAGLHFNTTTHVCDHPHRSGCRQ
ncbi:race-specific elicitor A4-like [Leguminivora glycinivorella]|uniref:race-specific elicitor A4-like n=1 Tax=Leguminivora glycinivorella TaxID=1035111 RepID=UPI00200E6056|nr:race-specific elicitor A4-like [Leguminivora glycinivorella]